MTDDESGDHVGIMWRCICPPTSWEAIPHLRFMTIARESLHPNDDDPG